MTNKKRTRHTCDMCGEGRATLRVGRFRVHVTCAEDLIESEIDVMRYEAAWQNGRLTSVQS